MKDKDIIDIFNDRKGKPIRPFKRSSVIIPLLKVEGNLHILFEMRALNLKSQPGDICLPGGKVEKDESYLEGAKREFIEELGLTEEDFRVVGEMDYFVSPYGTVIYPFVAEVYKKPEHINQREVDHVFTVPLSFFLDNEPMCHKMKIGPLLDEAFPFHLIREGKNYGFTTTTLNQYFYKYNNYIIWGFTALIVKGFAEIIKQHGKKSLKG